MYNKSCALKTENTVVHWL